MSSQTQQQLSTFSFPTIFYGVASSIAVVWKNQRSDILLNGEYVAQLELDEVDRTWFVASGELNDYDLVKEIGSRIEEKYY